MVFVAVNDTGLPDINSPAPNPVAVLSFDQV